MGQVTVPFTINDDEHEVTVESNRLLVHTLRDELGYTGANIGCETSMCGACTVLLDGEPVKSCTLLTAQAHEAEITTIEGLSEDGEYHPLQESFSEEHGLQCGYCTPGMILTSVGLLEENPDPDRDEIREGLEGNLCRCTGYENIVNAVESAVDKLDRGGADE